MSYTVMARRLRPQYFQDVVAQDHVVKTLQNAIRLGRIAHAYLFSGPRGTGKTTVARLLAKALNCENGPTPDPCGRCASCRAIADGKSMDVLEIDGASNRGIDEIRQLREEVGYAAAKGKRRVYIIDEVHMLTPEAFNALLKTLEEPPPHVVFVFATTAPHRMPETILSRCQRHNFRRIPTERIVTQLRKIAEDEGWEADEEGLFLIGRKSEGAMRDALGMLDQVISFSGGTVSGGIVRELLGMISRDLYFELTEAILERDSAAALHVVARLLEAGGDVGEFTEGLLEHFRHLLVACVEDGISEEDLPAADRARYTELAGRFHEDELLRMLQAVSELELNLGRVSEPRFWLELTVVKLAKTASTVALEDLLGRLEKLEGFLRREGGKGNLSPRRDAHRRQPERSNLPVREAKPRQHKTVQKGAVSKREAPVSERTGDAAGGARASQAAEAETTLKAIQEGWDDLVLAVRAQKISVGTFLAEGWPRALQNRQLVVAFKRNREFHANQVKRNRETVEAAVAEQLGVRVRLVCEVDDETGDGAEPAGPHRPEEDARVQTALRIFEGEIVR